MDYKEKSITTDLLVQNQALRNAANGFKARCEELEAKNRILEEARENANAACAKWEGLYRAELEKKGTWVSVKDRLPEYNPGTGAKSYWVAKKDNAGNWQMKIAQYCDYGYAMTMDAETEVTWRDWDFTKIVGVTHWMSLPEPPGKEE